MTGMRTCAIALDKSAAAKTEMYGRALLLATMLATSVVAAGCENMSTGQKGATAGAALGSGIALVTGAGLVTTVGAGLIGGAAGYLGGELVDKKK